MGGALFGRETAARREIDTGPDAAAQEARLVATAYFVWPLAVYERVVPREDASSWYRFHMRQAFWFGNITAAITLGALLWPLLASFVVTSVVVTIWLYAVAMIADVALFGVWLVLAARYSRRASHGDLFDVPWVVKLTGASSRKR